MIRKAMFAVNMIVFLFIFSCGNEKNNNSEKTVDEVVAIAGEDTVMLTDIKKILRDTSDTTKEKLLITAMQSILAKKEIKKIPKDEKENINKIVKDLSDNLSLQTGSEWDTNSSGPLFFSMKNLKEAIEKSKSQKDIKDYIKSIRESVLGKGDSSNIDSNLYVNKDTSLIGKRKYLAQLASQLFQVPDNVTNIVADFVYSPQDDKPDKSSKDVDNIVKGLVFDSNSVATQRKKVKDFKKPVHNIDNSKLALKYRSQSSITDTISKHIPYLKDLYKKKLKIYNDMSGKVVVTFRVGADGSVLLAKVTASDISKMEFLKPFLSYVKTIKFKKIPKNIGAMTFEFPFEFYPE